MLTIHSFLLDDGSEAALASTRPEASAREAWRIHTQ